MAFEFRDKTEEYVQFIKDGEGIYYKGNVGLLQAILLLSGISMISLVEKYKQVFMLLKEIEI